jgi:hypothetical protein
MLTPDYQEFANRYTTAHRDNTVISGAHPRQTRRNQAGVAVLQRW